MALSDPIVLNPDGTGNKNFARIGSGPRSASYFFDNGDNETYKILVSHTEGRRIRSVFRIDHQKLAGDLFDDNRSNLVSSSLYLVLDKPIAGFENTDSANLYSGLTGTLEASSSAKLNQWLNGES